MYITNFALLICACLAETDVVLGAIERVTPADVQAQEKGLSKLGLSQDGKTHLNSKLIELRNLLTRHNGNRNTEGSVALKEIEVLMLIHEYNKMSKTQIFFSNLKKDSINKLEKLSECEPTREYNLKEIKQAELCNDKFKELRDMLKSKNLDYAAFKKSFMDRITESCRSEANRCLSPDYKVEADAERVTPDDVLTHRDNVDKLGIKLDKKTRFRAQLIELHNLLMRHDGNLGSEGSVAFQELKVLLTTNELGIIDKTGTLFYNLKRDSIAKLKRLSECLPAKSSDEAQIRHWKTCNKKFTELKEKLESKNPFYKDLGKSFRSGCEEACRAEGNRCLHPNNKVGPDVEQVTPEDVLTQQNKVETLGINSDKQSYFKAKLISLHNILMRHNGNINYEGTVVIEEIAALLTIDELGIIDKTGALFYNLKRDSINKLEKLTECEPAKHSNNRDKKRAISCNEKFIELKKKLKMSNPDMTAIRKSFNSNVKETCRAEANRCLTKKKGKQ